MSKETKTTAEKLMDIIDDVPFFHDPSGTGWARADGHCYPVRSTQFKRWIQRKYYNLYGKTPHSQATQDVLDQATGIALFDSTLETVHVRVAKQNENIIIDTGSDYGVTKIEINEDGWTEGTVNIVNFWRPQGMNPLPKPAPGGSIDQLRDFLNYETEDDFRLIVAWILSALNPEISTPILNFQGEQGTAKSTNSKICRTLIDPNGALIRSAPKDERELIIQANNSRIICLDNLSGVKKWLSDALCRICTGSGFSTRRLYTNDEEQIFKVKRPIILNGIDDIATRGDLLDRSIVLNLPPIADDKRKDERDFWQEFEQKQPFILGALYDAISSGLIAEDPELNELPRMADFAEWITRCETAFGWNKGTLLNAYNRNRGEAVETGLDSDYLAGAIRKILSTTRHYEGTATELVEKVRNVSPEVNEKYLPTTRTLKSRLRRLAPALRKVGIEWDYNPNGNQRTYTLDRDENKVSKVSRSVQPIQKPDDVDGSDSSNVQLSNVEPNSAIFGEPSLADSFDEKYNSYNEPPF